MVRVRKELGAKQLTLVATGGLSGGIVPCCRQAFQLDKHLLLDGLKVIVEREKKA